ncbi:hypothetical protein [Aneurinibacillus thermoaerophilus]|uniref:Uncharacterized protein n=1 Tax=Aneurinibacillus thermoaerophilus TaxID=143495 RepID=A0A1G8FI24_ANETH|nr:hypothetical protein [Aneurinibacillus thermoaerophilus]MED0681430.1 hypothetical protein [Aneurinibacillus thermoaerophilus]MED0738995.1 hypothetical protein [Aneurinibacillus thermoaerophilus]MED0759102.1 hypothetical protein [Aneurinibacillus thermoaerophilus]MED0762598.1 hypothetical protein [Aneurinibacillus thermoaerophilus]MED0766285.1 hypothetical protein [Aneurinibacillus thermoaerophilus]
MRWMKLAIISIISFFVGILTYYVMLSIIWNQPIHDLIPVLLWGGGSYIIIVFPLYLLTFSLIQKKFQPAISQTVWIYPLAAALLCIIPTSLIFWMFGNVWSFKSMFSSEAILFDSFFAVSGIVFGFGWWMICGRTKNLKNRVGGGD